MKVHHYPKSGVVELRLQVVDWADSGLYTCKTNSPPVRAELVRLSLVDTRAEIAGPRERHVQASQPQ